MGLIDGISSRIEPVANYYNAPDKAKTEESTSVKTDETKVLGNVVAQSEDGDTLQENKESLEALKDGLVLKKADSQAKEETKADSLTKEELSPAQKYLEQQKEAAKKKAEQEKSESDEQDKEVSSLIGMTKSQVEQLYREGRISKDQYDKNMQLRDELAEKIQGNDVSAEVTKIVENGQKVQQDIENIFKASENGRIDIAAQIFN